jgi:hypothetical protein
VWLIHRAAPSSRVLLPASTDDWTAVDGLAWKALYRVSSEKFPQTISDMYNVSGFPQVNVGTMVQDCQRQDFDIADQIGYKPVG